MRKLLKYSAFFLAIIFPLFIFAQTPKKKITNASDLPRVSYQLPENLMSVFTDSTVYKQLSVKVRSDLQSILLNYDISDEATLKNIYKTLAHLDLQDGKAADALDKINKVHELESKPDLKLFTMGLFQTEAIAKAKLASQKNGGNTNQYFRDTLTQMLSNLPVTFYDQVKVIGNITDLFDNKFAESVIELDIAPKAKENGNIIYGSTLYELIEDQTVIQFFIPLANDIRIVTKDYLATHKKPAKTNIWTDRNVSLAGNTKLSPVVIAIWDTGIDTTLFRNQLFINPKESLNGIDDDKNGFIDDVNGIGIDYKGSYSSLPLIPLNDSNTLKYQDWVKESRLAQRLFMEGIDNEEIRAYQEKLKTETPAHMAQQMKLNEVFNFYNHGTQVADIAAKGNPAARILNARFIWWDNADKKDDSQTYEAWSRAYVENIKKYISYFKNQKVRVVNASWSMTRKGVEENLEKDKPEMIAKDRKILADKIFSNIKNSLLESIKNAPGILFVVSGGNRNSDAEFDESIPATLELPNIIATGAVDENGTAAMFTSFGKTISLYAPGVRIETVVVGGEKLLFMGTSAAAPQVTNLAAKLFALNSKLTVSQVKKLIEDGADYSGSDKRLKLINPKRSVELLKSRFQPGGFPKTTVAAAVWSPDQRQ